MDETNEATVGKRTQALILNVVDEMRHRADGAANLGLDSILHPVPQAGPEGQAAMPPSGDILYLFCETELSTMSEH